MENLENNRINLDIPDIDTVLDLDGSLDKVERSAELQDALEIIDFNVLKDIMSDYVRLSRVGSVNFIGPERFLRVIDTNLTKAGIYFNLAHIIGISAEEPIFSHHRVLEISDTTSVNGFKLSDEELESLNFLNTVIHEEWHAIGFTSKTDTEYEFKTITGFEEVDSQLDAILVAGRRLNEGFVQYMTGKTLVEYVRRVGNFRGVSADEGESYVYLLGDERMSYHTYGYEVYIVRLLIKSLAVLLEVSESEIEEALVASYIRGELFFDERLMEYFNEEGFGSQYTSLLSLLRNLPEDTEPETFSVKFYPKVRDSLYSILGQEEVDKIIDNEERIASRLLIQI